MPAEEKIKKKRKKLYSILAPGFLGERLIGDTFLESPLLMKGKTITTNLFNVLGDIKKQQIELNFLVDEIKENKGRTKIVQYKLANHYIKRLVRRGRNRIDDSFVVKDSKGAFLRIKTLIITNNKGSKSVRTDLLKKARYELSEILKKTTFENIIKEIIDYKLQKSLKQNLTKIFPIRQVEIRNIKIETGSVKETKIHQVLKTKKEERDEKEKALEEKIKKTQEKKPEKKEKEKKKDQQSSEQKESPKEVKEDKKEPENTAKKAEKK